MPDSTQRIITALDALTDGFSETVDYVATVNGKRMARNAIRRYDALIAQLAANVSEPLQSRAQGPGGGGKAGSRPPMNMVYQNCLDTIGEGADVAWRLLADDEPPRSLFVTLHELKYRARRVDGVPDYAYALESVALMAERWVHDARVLLGYESRKVTLADTVCGQCGGTLIVAVDATSDVRCAGTEESASCGMVYGQLEWISLLRSS